MNETEKKLEQIMAGMSAQTGGKIALPAKLAAEVMPEMILEQAANSAFAMPKEGGALDAETRVLIHLSIALATGSQNCIESNLNKARVLKISKEKIIEAFKIARLAEATRVLGNAEKLFQQIKEGW